MDGNLMVIHPDVWKRLQEERDDLRAQLAERDADLDDVQHDLQAVHALRAALDGLFDYFYHTGKQDHPWYSRAADALDDTAAAAQAHDDAEQRKGMEKAAQMLVAEAIAIVPPGADGDSEDYHTGLTLMRLASAIRAAMKEKGNA